MRRKYIKSMDNTLKLLNMRYEYIKIKYERDNILINIYEKIKRWFLK